jgi:hypothetical protein
MTMKYRVFKNKRLATTKMFDTYERARQWIRKQIRRNYTPESYIDLITKTERYGVWDCVSRNPSSISAANYSIRKAA